MWPYLLSFLLLASAGGLLFGGLRSLLDYRSIVDPAVLIDKSSLRFFTREYIQRRYYGLVVDPLPVDSTLPEFHLYAEEQDLESLDSQLPASGKTQYVSGHITASRPDLTSAMAFRYRGGLPLHWLYKKKSYRVKLPPFTTYMGGRQFDLVNPSTKETVTDWISYDLSRELGLLTPDFYPVRVYVNNAYNGLHFFLSKIDESFLRKNRRMPGSIYAGDTIYVPNPFGVDESPFETVFLDDVFPRMWDDERLWAKDSARNAQGKDDRRDIALFIDAIDQKDPAKFMELFEDYFDKDKYYRYWGLDTLVGTYHHDLFHNHKLYFDPYKGRFEPIEWDVRFWTNIKVKDVTIYPVLRDVVLNPVLEHERDTVAYEMLERFTPSDVIARIDKANEVVGPELAADPLRQAPDHRYALFVQDKTVPFSMKKYAESIEDLKLTYLHRHEFLEEIYNYARAGFALTDAERGGLLLSLSVTGNSAIRVDPRLLLPENLRGKVAIRRFHKGHPVGNPLPPSCLETLYPGRVISSGNVFNRNDSRAILGYGKDKLLWGPLNYQYLIEGEGLNLAAVGPLHDVDVVNAVTGKPAVLSPMSELWNTSETASIHPWELERDGASRDVGGVVLSGEVRIDEDTIYAKRQRVTILPGTTIKLAPGKSLVFYGGVVAKGTEDAPISFEQLVPGKPWGAIVVKGHEASGSRLDYVRFSGGSLTSQKLIDYPGQFNIHDVDSFEVNHCFVASNHIGDDAFHVAYSHGRITGCRFENTAFDALDIDISDVTISDSVFANVGNDAIDLMTSHIVVQNAQIDGAGDKCVSVGEETEVTVKGSRLFGCVIGVAVKDQSKAFLEDVQFGEIKEEPIALYKKNPRYGFGGEVHGARLSGIGPQDVHVENGSRNLIPEDAYVPGPISSSDATSRVAGGRNELVR